MSKVEEKKAARDAEIVASCDSGIAAVLESPLVQAAELLLDDVAAELFHVEHGDPLNYVRTQVLRSTGSIAANLAEGIGKAYVDDRRRFWLTARGSAYESVIWLRALQKTEQTEACIALCKQIDAAILAMTQ